MHNRVSPAILGLTLYIAHVCVLKAVTYLSARFFEVAPAAQAFIALLLMLIDVCRRLCPFFFSFLSHADKTTFLYGSIQNSRVHEKRLLTIHSYRSNINIRYGYLVSSPYIPFVNTTSLIVVFTCSSRLIQFPIRQLTS